jgi:cobalamin synthase
VVIQTAAVAIPILAWPALLTATVSVVAARAWFMRRLGGITGDCLGFQCQVTEAAVLVTLAW